MPVNLYYTQKVRGFQQEKVKYSKENVEIHLKRTKHQCQYCGSCASEVWDAHSECRRREVCNGKIKKDSLEFQSELSKMSLLYQMVGGGGLEPSTSAV